MMLDRVPYIPAGSRNLHKSLSILGKTLPLLPRKGLHKTPAFNSVGQKTAAALGNSFASLKPYPTWNFEWDMDRITGNEALASSVIASFMGAYMTCQAQANLFLFTDPQDSTVTQSTGVMLNVTPGASVPMGQVGDGASTQFQLARTIGGSPDVIQNLNASIQVHLNGSLTSAYSISSKGVVTFTSAPGSGVTITWAGNFYFLCRFSEDMLDSVRSFTVNSGVDQWDVSSIRFSSEFQ